MDQDKIEITGSIGVTKKQKDIKKEESEYKTKTKIDNQNEGLTKKHKERERRVKQN